MKKLIFLIGISGSGKSTYIKSHFIPEIVVCPDDIRRKLSGDVSDQSQNANVWSLVPDLLRKALDRYGKAVLDATNVDANDRKKVLDKFIDGDIEKVAIIFDVDPEEAKRRVGADIKAGVDRSSVPDYAIDRQYGKFKAGYSSIKQQFDRVISSDSGGVSMAKEDIQKIKQLVKEEMKKITEEDAKQAMERAQYQTYQDMYLTPQSNWRLKQNTTMYDSDGRVYQGKVGEIHKIQTVEYDFVHTGEVITECGDETYSIDADDFRKAFEMVNDEQGLQVNNESIDIKEDVRKLVKIKNYFGKNIKESIERLEKTILQEDFYQRNNLASANCYYKVISPFTLYKLVGTEPGNAYYGKAQIMRPIWEKVTANVGDEIHNLVGGLFYIDMKVKKAYKMHLEEPEFAPFENKKSYDSFKLSKLQKISSNEIDKNIKYESVIKELEYEDSDDEMQDAEDEEYEQNKRWSRVIPKFYYNDDFDEVDLLILIVNDQNGSIAVSAKKDKDTGGKVLTFQLVTGKSIDIAIPTNQLNNVIGSLLDKELIEYDDSEDETYYYFLSEEGKAFCQKNNLQNRLRAVLNNIKEIQD